MKIFKKIQSAGNIITQKYGFHRFISILKGQYKLPIPQSSHSKWKAGIESEVEFWDSYFRTKGLKWSDDYQSRFNPDLPLQSRVVSLLPESLSEIHILDVGAGPLTYLGKKSPGKKLKITAVDSLADEYEKIFDKYHINPLVKTRKADAENLKKIFPQNSFDLVFARNCIDHAYHPENAIKSMIGILKKGCFLLLEHIPNEAENENYQGLHQWNFSRSNNGDFLISSKLGEVNMTRKYADLCDISCEIIDEGGNGAWLITKILKK